LHPDSAALIREGLQGEIGHGVPAAAHPRMGHAAIVVRLNLLRGEQPAPPRDNAHGERCHAGGEPHPPLPRDVVPTVREGRHDETILLRRLSLTIPTVKWHNERAATLTRVLLI
jgi:hypothetical protein